MAALSVETSMPHCADSDLGAVGVGHRGEEVVRRARICCLRNACSRMPPILPAPSTATRELERSMDMESGYRMQGAEYRLYTAALHAIPLLPRCRYFWLSIHAVILASSSSSGKRPGIDDLVVEGAHDRTSGRVLSARGHAAQESSAGQSCTPAPARARRCSGRTRR